MFSLPAPMAWWAGQSTLEVGAWPELASPSPLGELPLALPPLPALFLALPWVAPASWRGAVLAPLVALQAALRSVLQASAVRLRAGLPTAALPSVLHLSPWQRLGARVQVSLPAVAAPDARAEPRALGLPGSRSASQGRNWQASVVRAWVLVRVPLAVGASLDAGAHRQPSDAVAESLEFAASVS